MECELCGGTNFIKEHGFFYCSECQTQSQELREHAFQEEVKVNTKSSKKLKDEKKQQNVTSWECYNVVIFSLTQQLINLGANQTLKRVVKCLWLHYLEKLEVLNTTYDIIPKLQLVNSRRDAHILLNKKKKKRKRKQSSSTDDYSTVTSVKSSSIKRQMTRKKTALVQSQYDAMSQQLTQDSSSLHNETLPSLRGSSSRSETPNEKLRYNVYSTREMKKKMSKKHVSKHKIFDEDLKCHRKITSKEYEFGVHFLSPIKIYCLLYLGLLITKDKLQLGDLLRFIREGHLSFNNYVCLFPEDYSNKLLNIANNNKNAVLTSSSIRTYTAKMAKFLGVTTYIVVPDLNELCRRFCNEMNLPDEITHAVGNLVSKTAPQMSVKGESIPNYEGRLMSIIIITLKLLFGFDGITEFHFSRYANLVKDTLKQNTFDVIAWTEYIAYRKLFMKTCHFPSFYLNNTDMDSDLLLQYIKSQNVVFSNEANLSREMKDFEEILLKIKDYQYDDNVYNEIPPSLTPYNDYVKVLCKLENKQIVKSLLDRNFASDRIDFLLRPNCYLNFSDVQIKNGGANDNWIINKVKRYRKPSKKKHISVIVEIIDRGKYVLEMFNDVNVSKSDDIHTIQDAYHTYRKHIFHKNFKYLENHCRYLHHHNIQTKHSYDTHYNPFERYWLNCITDVDLISKKEFETFFENHTSTFKIIFDECSRIVEQSHRELFKEFQATELFVTYSSALLKKNSIRSKKVLDSQLNYHIQQAERQW